MAEAEPVHDAGTELLDQHIGAGQQRAQTIDRIRRLEVERQAPLAAVEQGEHGAAALDLRGKMAHVVAAAGALDFQHLGARLGENEGGERTGQ